MLSIVVAFLLFGLLQGLNAGMDKAIADEHLDRLLTDPRVPGGRGMPYSAQEKIARLPGVVGIAARTVFVGSFREPGNLLVALATDPKRWFGVRPEYSLPQEQLDALQTLRTAIVVTPAMLKANGWKIGDKIPLQSRMLRRDGSGVWTFDLVGVFDTRPEPSKAYLALINYSYFDEERVADRGKVDRFIVRIADPQRSVSTAAAIDRLFANSDNETRTRSEQDLAESQMQQAGDIRFFTNAIVAAVLFTLLFLTANTMQQSVRERMPEFGILKAVGLGNFTVHALVLGEAVILCVTAAALGLALSAIAAQLLRETIGEVRMSATVVGSGIAVALFLAGISALPPTWRLQRMQIVDALAGR